MALSLLATTAVHAEPSALDHDQATAEKVGEGYPADVAELLLSAGSPGRNWSTLFPQAMNHTFKFQKDKDEPKPSLTVPLAYNTNGDFFWSEFPLKVCFAPNLSARARYKVQLVAKRWEFWPGRQIFEFAAPSETDCVGNAKYDVRIAFDSDINQVHSLPGTLGRMTSASGGYSVHLPLLWLTDAGAVDSLEFDYIVQHELGHVLGFMHGIQHPKCAGALNSEKIWSAFPDIKPELVAVQFRPVIDSPLMPPSLDGFKTVVNYTLGIAAFQKNAERCSTLGADDVTPVNLSLLRQYYIPQQAPVRKGK